jgi:putative dimethyl sulfoxide reductase chaperone
MEPHARSRPTRRPWTAALHRIGDRHLTPLHILAALLAVPEDDGLDVLRDLYPLAPWLGPAIAELERLPLAQWQGEHTRLFVSGYPSTPCPPFESAYRHGQMGGTAASELARLYLRAGLQATGAPADFLGTLLECAALLEEQGDPGQVLLELWDEHLLRWLPRFAQDLQTHSVLGLYQLLGAELARLAEGASHD